MQFQNNFDLEEFLAYLLPGFLILGVLILEYRGWFVGLFQALPSGTPDLFPLFLAIVLFVTVSVVIGHVSSLVSRYVWRELTNLFLGDPEQAIFAPNDRFFTTPLNHLIARHFARVFGMAMTEQGVRDAVPRLIRSYVFTRSQPATVSRERIVRARSICSNLVTPIMIIAVLGPFGMTSGASGVLTIVAFLLLLKQRDLDVREAKEIYLTFVALADTSPAAAITPTS